MQSPPPNAAPIFSQSARRAKRQRAHKGDWAGADFVHARMAADVVDRLETILRRFDNALFAGAAAAHVKAALTDAADVAKVTLSDEVAAADHIVAAPTELPFDDGQFDLVVSAMALHAVSDVPGALREARRVLKPDGLFIASFPGEETLRELRTALRDAEASVTGGVAPRVSPFIAVKDGGALLQHAGFALPVADVVHLPVSYSQPTNLFQDLRHTGETSALTNGPKGAMRRDVFAALIKALEAQRDASGDIPMTVDLVTLTGWAPHESQPKALRPGSAKASMAKAIAESAASLDKGETR